MQTYRLLGIALTQHRKAGSEQYHPPAPEYPALNPGAPSRGDESLPRHPEFSSGAAYEEGPKKGVTLFLYQLGHPHPKVTEDWTNSD